MLQHLLPPNRKEAPRKKIRGLKRYFRRVLARAEACDLDLDEDSWFEYMHEHCDWPGYGNVSWPMRARHLEALAIVFRRCAEQLKAFSKPYQLWIYLDVHQAAYDAVFVHSPNPNRDNFPLVVEGAVWGIEEVSQYFQRMLPGHPLRAGRVGDGDSYYVYSPSIGLSLEETAACGAGQAPAQP